MSVLAATIPLRGHRPRSALYALCLGFFMISLDMTIVNVAIPSIQQSLGAGLTGLLWVNSAYALCLAVPLVLAGRLGDYFGPRHVFCWGTACFTAASLMCALAPDAGSLIAARCIQGLGAAAMTPQSMTLIAQLFEAGRRGRALGFWGAVGGVAMAAGPVLGGLILQAFSWRGIFLVNVPIGLAAVVAVVFLVPGHRPAKRHRFDPLGTVLVGAALCAVLFALQNGGPHRWGILGTGLALLAVFVVWERHYADEPVLPLRLLGDRPFAAATLGGVAAGCALTGVVLALMLDFQLVLGYSALSSALLATPMFLASAVSAPCAGRLSDRAGASRVVCAGFAVFAVGAGALALALRPACPPVLLLAPLVLAGLGIGAVAAPLAAIAVRGVEPELIGAATGVFNTGRQLGGALGVAVSAAVMGMHINGAGARSALLVQTAVLAIAALGSYHLTKRAKGR